MKLMIVAAAVAHIFAHCFFPAIDAVFHVVALGLVGWRSQL